MILKYIYTQGLYLEQTLHVFIQNVTKRPSNDGECQVWSDEL